MHTIVPEHLLLFSLTKHRVSQLPTDHSGITAVPGVMTDGTPDTPETNLYSSFSRMMTSQSDLTLSTVGWNCQHGLKIVISTDHPNERKHPQMKESIHKWKKYPKMKKYPQMYPQMKKVSKNEKVSPNKKKYPPQIKIVSTNKKGSPNERSILKWKKVSILH